MPLRSSQRLKASMEQIKKQEKEGNLNDVQSLQHGEKKSAPKVKGYKNETVPIESHEHKFEYGEANEHKSEEGDEVIDYNRMPQNPNELDDDEFRVYISLRAWRLRRKNELEVEPFKICQNRTLCELIRKRRNDDQFASRIGRKQPLNNTNDGKNNDTKEAILDDAAVERDLLSIWGIGPSKSAKDGFGWEILDILNSEENIRFLQCSRNNAAKGD